MSSEVAFLEIRVGAQGATEARNRLKELTEQSERAEKAAAKLAAETEKAEARKAAAVSAAAAKADKVATDMAIKAGVYQQKMADDVAKAEARKAAIFESAARKQSATIQATGQRQLDEVRKWLLTEEEALRESHLRRRRIIESQATGSNKQMMLAAQDYKYNQQLLTLRGSRLDSSKYVGTGPGMQTASAAVSSLAAGGGIQGLTQTLIRFAPAAAAAAASYAVVTKAMGEASAYKTAILQLSATTDGIENATRAYEALDAMEEKIPISTEEMARAFSRLVNAGLDPSENSLRSMAEIALGTGNSLEEVTEKVANATMGNFRGLRELGIRAEESGNQISMTFRGVTTSIGNDSKSIQSYLNNLGKTAFAGSIVKEMDSLDGSIFQLKDAWSDMFRDIGKGNIGPVIKDMVDTAKGAVDLLSSALNSDALADALAGIKIGFVEIAGAAHKAAGFTKWLFTGDTSMSKNADATTEALKREIVEERKGIKNTREFSEALKGTNDELGKYAKGAGGASTALDSFNQSMSDANIKFAESEENRKAQEAKARAQRDQAEFKQLLEKLKSEEEQIKDSYLKRQKLIDQKTKGKTELGAVLSTANFGIYQSELANSAAAKMKEAQDKANQDLEESLRKEVNALEDSLRDREDVARAHYENQVAMVTQNVNDEIRAEALRTGLLQKEIDRRLAVEDEKARASKDKRNQKDALFEPYQSEIEQIKKNEQLKLEAYQEARDKDVISAEEHALLKAKIYKKTETDIVESDLRNKEMIYDNTAAMFGNLAQASKNMGGQQSESYKALFAMSKAFSVAQATMSIATGTAKALELGWPAGIAAGMAVAAQGAGLLAMITSSNYSGAYDKGGTIPAGRIGLVGERGPELVQGPAVVTSRQQTAQLMGGGHGGGEQRITIINAPDTRGAAEFARSSAGEMTYVNSIRRNATAIRQILGVR